MRCEKESVEDKRATDFFVVSAGQQRPTPPVLVDEPFHKPIAVDAPLFLHLMPARPMSGVAAARSVFFSRKSITDFRLIAYRSASTFYSRADLFGVPYRI
jgi:hypothetical protein